MSKVKQTDILISGGGTPGLTLALLLGKLGVDVTVVDPSPLNQPSDTGRDTRTSALMVGSINIVKSTGTWTDCESAAGKMERLRIIDDTGRGRTPVRVDFHACEIGQELFGMNVPNTLLRNALLREAAKNRNISLLMPDRLASFAADDFGVTVQLEGGEALCARLMVGADGRNSPTREGAGIAVHRKDYGQKAITCFISHSKDHEDTSTEFHRPGGPFTLVPLPGKLSSVVWVEFDNDAERFFAMDKGSFEHALQSRTRDLLGTIRLERPPQLWPLAMQKVKSVTAQRVALIAEAAHVIHPLGAQGLNLSLRDTASLAEIIADALRTGLDPGSKAILNQYEKSRKQDISARVWGTDMLNRIVSNNSPVFHNLRKAGLKSLNYISPLKQFAMQEGMAPKGGNSRLAQGKAL